MRNAGYPSEAPERLLELSAVTQFNHQPVGRPGYARNGDTFEGPAQPFPKLVQEEGSIAPLQPQFVVMNDDV